MRTFKPIPQHRT
jgi:hypothetical protein